MNIQITAVHQKSASNVHQQQAKAMGAGRDGKMNGPQDNFWEIGNYKRVVKRINDGAFLLDELSRMVAERASIEQKYSSQLRGWVKKWYERIDKGFEEPDGTIKQGWLRMADEGEAVADVHLKMHDRLQEEVGLAIQKWKKEHFHRELFKWKEAKRAEEGFDKAQKPWRRMKRKADKYKKRYHGACLRKDLLKRKADQMQQDPSVSTDEMGKIKERLKKLDGDILKHKQAYQISLDALKSDKERYKLAMDREFEKCQDDEHLRMDFVKETLFQYQRILNIDISSIEGSLKEGISGMNSDNDLVRYAERKGVGMPLYIPSFEDWDHSKSAPIFTDMLMEEGSLRHTSLSVPVAVGASNTSLNDSVSDVSYDSEEEWNDINALVPAGPEKTPGIPLRALYDYTAEEEDELTFKVGDVITLLEDEDEQGWCRGIHANGEEGLFPANYVEPIEEDA